VLAEKGIDLAGRIVARPGRWILWKVRRPLRYAHTQTGIFADGQTGCSLAPCPVAESAYNQFSTNGNRNGYMVVDVSRLNACGAPVGPAGVRVTLGTLVRGKDKEPHIGRPLAVRRWTLRTGTARRFVIPTPRPPFRVEVRIAPTFSPSDYGESDQRRLGGSVGYRFSPTPVRETQTACS
jgi:hypothetical protein